jgi:hypothetical protein
MGDVNSIGIGFSYNKELVKVVELISKSQLMVNVVSESEDGGVDARGMMLTTEMGIYYARIMSIKNMKKALHDIGPPHI